MLLFASPLLCGPSKIKAATSLTTTRKHPRTSCRHGIFATQNELIAKRRRTMQTLRRDLEMQYSSPRSLDWTIYDDYIAFDDPMTILSGKLQYRVRSRHFIISGAVLYDDDICTIADVRHAHPTDCFVNLKGMILTIGLFIVRFLFKGGTAEFKLTECELTEDLEKVRTTFETKGVTRWGSFVNISGEDFFWFGNNSHLIVRHQSTWDQRPEDVMNAFWGRDS